MLPAADLAPDGERVLLIRTPAANELRWRALPRIRLRAAALVAGP